MSASPDRAHDGRVSERRIDQAIPRTVGAYVPRAAMSRFILRNVDVVFAVAAMVLLWEGLQLRPHAYCGGSTYVEPTTMFWAVGFSGVASFGVAAIAAVFCRRHVASKIVAFLLYAAFVLLALEAVGLASSPCALY